MQILKQWKTEPEKWLFRILLVVFIASMVPVLYLSRYGFPNCDDFTYGLETHRVWNATHSFGEVLKTALAVTKETWQLWQGTWFSIFLMTLTPGVSGKMVFPDDSSYGRNARRKYLCADAYSALPVH